VAVASVVSAAALSAAAAPAATGDQSRVRSIAVFAIHRAMTIL